MVDSIEFPTTRASTKKLRHADNADRIRADIGRLEQQLSGEARAVAATFDRVLDLLGRREFVSGWSLTPKGSVLAGIFHECDLLIAEAIELGILDGLSTVDLAAVVSCVVYERRSSDDVDHPHPSTVVEARFVQIEDLSFDLQHAEEAAGLPIHRPPDNGFARTAALWASGADLSRILDVVPDMGAGDFVRTVRQVVDLLRQIERCAPRPELRKTAARAASAMFRGIVVGSDVTLEPGREGGAQ